MLKHPKIPHENAFELLLIGFHPMFAIKHEALLSLLSLSLSLSTPLARPHLVDHNGPPMDVKRISIYLSLDIYAHSFYCLYWVVLD